MAYIIYDLSGLFQLSTAFQIIQKLSLEGVNTIWKRIAIGVMYPAQNKIFKSEGAYNGHEKWKKSKRALKDGGVTLSDTGALKQSVGILWSNPGEMWWGTNLYYGGFHQFGTSRTPQREFIFVTPEDLQKAALIAQKYHLEQLDKGLRSIL